MADFDRALPLLERLAILIDAMAERMRPSWKDRDLEPLESARHAASYAI
ncbi:MAG: hypothetical protein J2P49_09960 [Methylocapsa sp.]|nr:hypothetical protein [Methylocapsa sp.]